MKWNLIKRWHTRRQQRSKLRELSQFASVFMDLTRLQESGILAWDAHSRRLFIDSSLALVMMAKGADSWTCFLQNVYLWLYSRLCDQAWADFLQSEELKAVREYTSQLSTLNSQLKRSDIDRIREARRSEILLSDMEPPHVEPFEFFIVAPPTKDGSVPPMPTDPVGHLIAVGHYDPETDHIEMASWDDVRPLLSQEK